MINTISNRWFNNSNRFETYFMISLHIWFIIVWFQMNLESRFWSLNDTQRSTKSFLLDVIGVIIPLPNILYYKKWFQTRETRINWRSLRILFELKRVTLSHFPRSLQFPTPSKSLKLHQRSKNLLPYLLVFLHPKRGSFPYISTHQNK